MMNAWRGEYMCEWVGFRESWRVRVWMNEGMVRWMNELLEAGWVEG